MRLTFFATTAALALVLSVSASPITGAPKSPTPHTHAHVHAKEKVANPALVSIAQILTSKPTTSPELEKECVLGSDWLDTCSTATGADLHTCICAHEGVTVCLAGARGTALDINFLTMMDAACDVRRFGSDKMLGVMADVELPATSFGLATLLSFFFAAASKR